MDSVNGHIQLSASDLVNHLSCRHLTALNFEAASGVRAAPKRWDPGLELLRQRGLAHERDYIRHLEDSGLQAKYISGAGVDTESVTATVNAMRAGYEIIVQGALAEGRWGGRADILHRVDVPSKLGHWSYEVTDTKLARETKSGTILQLSLYSDLVQTVQGELPEFMYVVAPWTGFEAQEYRTTDFAAYYRLVRAALESAIDGGAQAVTYPDPKEHCDICRWSSQCEERRRSDDHLCLVANISSLQIGELKQRVVNTTAALAAVPLPLPWKPERGAAASYERVREQARLQVAGRNEGRPVFEKLDLEPETGLALLPEPSPGDIFFDFEGDPFVGPGGLEYLFGYLTAGDGGKLQYTGLWAMDYEGEKRNFQRFVDWVMERWRQYPGMHIYHYAAYEPSAMKRLMGRHATREEEVDQMLRAGLFVDLYRVVRGGLRASVESYSIKKLEEFFGFQRDVDLPDANSALYGVSAALELGYPEAIREEDKEAVEGYNRDDCVSTFHLRNWLEGLREELIESGAVIDRPTPNSGEPADTLSERREKFLALAERIARDVPADPEQRSEEEQACWILAHLLDWHWREMKVAYWERYRMAELTEEDLTEEREAIAGLTLQDRVGGTAKAPVHRYRFEDQETGLRGGERLFGVGGVQFGALQHIDLRARTVDIKKRTDTADVHALAVYASDVFNTDEQANSLFRLGEQVVSSGIAGPGEYGAARDLLLRRPPRLGGQPIRHGGETALEAALRIVPLLQSGVLPIQGPPGSGKTYTGARMIVELVSQGKRVGITANSHKVIRNLMDEAMKAADERGIDVQAVQRCPPEDFTATQNILLAKNNPEVGQALSDGARIIGGSSWLWSRDEMAGTVDVLFVDEAAQMSLANVLAVSPAADSLVLLGDPQQLDQPTRAAHPDGAGLSALAYLLDGRQTIEPEQGLFLEETWRLHPDICAFTSELFYDNKLGTRQGMEKQQVVSGGPLSGVGLRLLPVVHQGNRSSSDEEADAVAELFRQLTGGNSAWIDDKGKTCPITAGDVLIIAPYNAQVAKILDRLPGARVGSVDKFQGQEAPVVVYSMTTSTPEEAPHGMEFLYSLNRLNVATSRARCVCVLVASPELFAPECRTPRQMQLANAFCRYRELATEIAL